MNPGNPEPGVKCIPGNMLARVLESGLGTGECARARTHVATCPVCQGELERRLRGAARGRRFRAWWQRMSGIPRRTAVLLGVAALLVAAAAGGLWEHHGHEAVAAGAVRFGLLVPAGEVTAAPRRFQWEPVRGAARYRVRLMEVDGTVLWSAESTGTSADAAPSEELATAMAPGRALLWEVTAHDARGAMIGAGGPASFHIASRPVR